MRLYAALFLLLASCNGRPSYKVMEFCRFSDGFVLDLISTGDLADYEYVGPLGPYFGNGVDCTRTLWVRR
jgi:hypothetical protein